MVVWKAWWICDLVCARVRRMLAAAECGVPLLPAPARSAHQIAFHNARAAVWVGLACHVWGCNAYL